MDDRAVIRNLEGVKNKRTMVFVIVGFIVFAVLIGVIVGGFRGRDISKGAAAMSEAAGQTQPKAPAPPPSNPAK